jgi:cytochrome c biogenesis protein CcmG/thiol:disulfide interchange protein DsbE
MAPSSPSEQEARAALRVSPGALAPRRRALAAILLLIAVGIAYWALTMRLLGPPGVQPGPGSSPIVIGASPLQDKPAPEFTLTDVEGHTVRLADYRGRPVIVNFWASWCIPCRAEFALFADARRKQASKGLEILGVIYKDSPDAARSFMAAHDAQWPALIDPNGAVATAYHVIGAPTSYYVDRAGIVRAVSYGPPPSNVLDDQLAKIL